jgi:hypothetical protein
MNEITFYSDVGKITGSISGSSEVCELTISYRQSIGENWIVGIYFDSEFYIENGKPVKKDIQPNIYYDFNYSTKQWEANLNFAGQLILNNRNQLLQESDWTDTVSAQTRLGETLYNSWQTYRQELRDIPQQQGFPLNVTFPTIPQ